MVAGGPRTTRPAAKSGVLAARELLAEAEAAFGPQATLPPPEQDVSSSSTPAGSRKPSKSLNSTASRVSRFFDDDTTTFRNGIAGEHYEVESALVDCSSSGQEKQGAHWVSDSDGEQWCLYDLGQKTVLTELNLKLKSGACNPQCVALSYCTADHLKKAKESTFISVKRSYVGDTAESLHLGFRCEDEARFWKVSYPINWGGEKTVIEDLQFIAEDVGSRKLCSGLKQMSHEHSTHLGKLCNIFDETATLTDEQKEVRSLARKHNVPLGDAETLRLKFEKYDEDNSGNICKEEFSNILRELIRVKNTSDIPQERFNHYWREVDLDHSGEISFEEFLIWYTNIVKTGSLNPKSFYATFGGNRLNVLAAATDRPERN
mmetsp:Transcript_1286/g.2865  ORF Transcript_1286/g.2865 Transcript_1286/m.2865 type:complete len:375 (+) Transcript_1286:86-1210(+)|eukprot:CAMPEP_0178991092 /NCGR_PEP_ID=MMETSP0795-20121207/5328_1 /TAXON_ID=88552 /ORGANISM="Amoebophrya sp., Strain Ameob2" /LENGTH=374 /DNA_ID=CAMNT_0020682747 /DNA_START=207 /DNA_END=1331 /DNA_ORIENTATION=+